MKSGAREQVVSLLDDILQRHSEIIGRGDEHTEECSTCDEWDWPCPTYELALAAQLLLSSCPHGHIGELYYRNGHVHRCNACRRLDRAARRHLSTEGAATPDPVVNPEVATCASSSSSPASHSPEAP